MPICQLITVARRKAWDNWLGLVIRPSTPRLEDQEIQMEKEGNDDNNSHSYLSHLIHKITCDGLNVCVPLKFIVLKPNKRPMEYLEVGPLGGAEII